MNRRLLDLWVGMFVALGFCALLFLALKVGNASSLQGDGATYTLNAEFENIGGLKVHAPVKSAGVVIGQVESIKLVAKKTASGKNAGNVAAVVLKVGKEFQFSKDTTTEILTSGLLGEQYVDLETGGDSNLLVDGDKLDPSLTSSAIVLERALTQFMLNKSDSSSPSSSSSAGAGKTKDPLE